MISGNVNGPNGLLADYKKYEFILNVDKKALIDDLFKGNEGQKRSLNEIKEKMDLAMLFVTHDLRVAAQICDKTAVMKLGEIVEYGNTYDVFHNPQHAYTKSLLAAVPGKDWTVPDLSNAQ